MHRKRTSYLSVLTAVAALAVFGVQSARAQLTFYNTRSDFNAAFPGLAVEDFEDGTPQSSGLSGPIDNNTNNAAFQPGDILDGLRLDFPGSSANQYFFNNNSAYNTGNGTNVVTTNHGGNSLDLLFYNNDVTAAGFDLGASTTNTALTITYTINVFNGATLLGSTTTDVTGGTFAFLGISSSQIFTRMNIAQASFETIDNIAFGAATPQQTGVIPEPGTCALLATGLLPLAGGVLRRRRNA